MTDLSEWLETQSRVIMHTSEPSGLGHYVSKLVVALERVGVPIVLFCPANSDDEATVLAAGVEVVHAASRGTSQVGLAKRIWRNFSFLAKTALIQQRLVRSRDIVHFQGMLHLPLGFVFLLLVKARGGSLVLTAHDPLPHRWRFPRGLRWLERGMLYMAYRLTDRIVVHNQIGKDVLIRTFHLDASRIAVIPHGPYLRATTEDGFFPDFQSLRLLAFGSIRENKGLHLAIAAVQTLNARAEHPVRLTIAGPTDAAEQQYWKKCKRMIAARDSGIDVIDRSVREDEVGPLLERHHAVLLPYTKFFSESGVASLAFSHHRPIVATSAGGLGDLIKNKVGVIPIESPTAASVAEAISAAVRLGPERLKRMGIEGGDLLRRTRSWDSIGKKTAALYSQLGARSFVFEKSEPADVPVQVSGSVVKANPAGPSLIYNTRSIRSLTADNAE